MIKIIIRFKISLFFFGLLIINLLQSQECNGNFGDPVFLEDFGTNPVYRAYNGPLNPSPAGYQYINAQPDDGFYTISNVAGNSFLWHVSEDHTQDDVNFGNMMIVNASFQPGEFFRKEVNDLCGQQLYRFSVWILNLVPSNVCGGNSVKPNLKFIIETLDGTQIGEYDTGLIPTSNTPIWREYFFDFVTPANISDVQVVLVNNNIGGCGNDLALDDISFKACGPNIQLDSDDLTVSDNLCSNDQDFTIHLNVPNNYYTEPNIIVQQSEDQGTTWVNILNTNQFQVTIQNGSYNDGTLFRFLIGEGDNVLNNSCNVVSNVFEVNIHPNPEPPLSLGDKVYCVDSPIPILSVIATENTTVNWYDNLGNLLYD